MSPRAFFEELEDALVGFLSPDLRGFSSRRSARNLKLWYGTESREHFEVQLISERVLNTDAPVLEIGFHAEHTDAERNDRVLDALRTDEDVWRVELGPQPEAGAFVGLESPWRRLSELWEGPDVVAPEAAIEAADRLAAYIRTLEPLHRKAAHR